MEYKLNEKVSLKEIKTLARESGYLVYATQTCYWKVNSPVHQYPPSVVPRLPCGPRGEMLLETDDPIGFIRAAEKNPAHYGRHGLRAFVAAYHGNVTTEGGLPTSFESWDEYNKLIDSVTEETAAH